tara:strand:+ start:1095 stop:1304 length:210 start_codon:yes stop_codon:yes gene_type:complete
MSPNDNIQPPIAEQTTEYPQVDRTIDVSEVEVKEQGGEVQPETPPQEVQQTQDPDKLVLDWGMVLTFFK